MTTLLTARDVSVHSASGTLVAPVSLDLQAGRPLTLIGETGSGKSLLAQALLGLLPNELQASGTVQVGGETFELATGGDFRALWGRVVGVLPQEPWLALDPTMRAGEQIAEGHRYLGHHGVQEARRRAGVDLAHLGLDDAARKLPAELSGGMAQRVAFAAARAGGARIILADEPTKGLDVQRRDEVARLLLGDLGNGGALLTITHDLELARQLGGELLVMLDGQVIERGEAASVLDHPREAYIRRLLEADPSRWPGHGRAEPGGEPVLVAQGLGKQRGGRQLFSGQDLTVRKGEIIGITGPSGCGKSSFGDVLLGVLQADAGRVTRTTGIATVRYQKLYQDPPSAFPPHLTLGQALRDLVRLHDLDASRIDALLPRLKLSPEILGRRPAAVSGGELQRLAVLRVLLLDPVFLFADEPTSRLDPIIQQDIVELLVELARERGCAVLLVSHDRALINRVSDRQIALAPTAIDFAPCSEQECPA